MARFEAVFYEGEINERLPEWCVVEWLPEHNGAKSGRTVWKTYDMIAGEHSANEMAMIFQHEYNVSFAKEFA